MTYGNQPMTTHSDKTNDQFNGVMIDRLFVRFRSIWGHIWTSNFKTEKAMFAAKREWGLALRHYTESDVDYMIGAARRDLGDKPPTLQKFMKYPKPYQHITVAQLLGVHSTKKTAKEEMAKIRGKFHV